MELPTVLTSTDSTMHLQSGQGETLATTSAPQTQAQDMQASLTSPTLAFSQVARMTAKQVEFAEEPLHALIGKSPEQMTDQELMQHVELLRQYRKSPQTLTAKLKKDEEKMDLEFGQSEDKKLRQKVSKTLGEKAEKRVGANAEVQGAKLAGKYTNFGVIVPPQ